MLLQMLSEVFQPYHSEILEPTLGKMEVSEVLTITPHMPRWREKGVHAVS